MKIKILALFICVVVAGTMLYFSGDTYPPRVSAANTDLITSYYTDHLFSDFQEWNYSVNNKQKDLWKTIIKAYFSSSSGYGASFVDINGDGLSDVLFSYVMNSSIGTGFRTYGVLINNGANDFSALYKCVVGPTGTEFWGDCAQ